MQTSTNKNLPKYSRAGSKVAVMPVIISPREEPSGICLQSHPDYCPSVKASLPAAEAMRTQGRWWIRCASNEWIDVELCYAKFLDVNAMNNKKHPCFNCPLGKAYREMRAEGQMKESTLETLLQ